MRQMKLEVRDEVREGGTRVYTLAGSLYGSSEGYGFQEEVRQQIADFGGVDKVFCFDDGLPPIAPTDQTNGADPIAVHVGPNRLGIEHNGE